MDEEMELSTLQDALEESRAEVERLQTLVADREAQNVQLRQSLAEAQQAAAAPQELQARYDALAGEADGLRQGLTAAQEEARTAAGKYREAVLAGAPELPPELVTGESVAEIDGSLAQARQIVGHLREHLETQGPVHVPPGAPPRSQPDFSSLSPEEKIALGLRQR
jgi:hypothetical protein